MGQPGIRILRVFFGESGSHLYDGQWVSLMWFDSSVYNVIRISRKTCVRNLRAAMIIWPLLQVDAGNCGPRSQLCGQPRFRGFLSYLLVTLLHSQMSFLFVCT